MTVATYQSRAPIVKRIPSRASSLSLPADVATFLIGSSLAFGVGLVGVLPVSELLATGLLPLILATRAKRAFRREYLMLYVFLGLWLFGEVLTDIYIGTPMQKLFKGVARILFLAIDFLALSVLVGRNTRRIIIFTLGLSVSLFLEGRAFEFLGREAAWKFGISLSVAFPCMLVASYFLWKRRVALYVLVNLGLAALNLVFAYRSQVGVALVSAFIIFPMLQRRPATASTARRNWARIALLVVLAGTSAYLANMVIEFAAQKNFFDEDTQLKFQEQSQGKYGVLFGGRPELLVSIRAIMDSPLIGHGSYAVDYKYHEMLRELLYQYGYSEGVPDEEEERAIPTHSHITLAWVDAGILGGLFWIYVLVLVGTATVRLSEYRPPLAALFSFFFVNFVWDIFFSPFAAWRRMSAAFFILILFNVIEFRPKVKPPLVKMKTRWQQRTSVGLRQPSPLRRLSRS